MDTQSLSAILLIAGFAVLLPAWLFSPPGIYQTPDLQRRVQIIEEYKTRWNITQPLIGLSLLLTAIGFAVLALHLRTLATARVPGLAAVAFIVALIPAAIFLYQQTTDPLGSYEGAYSGMETLYYWLALAGLLLFGVAFLQAGLPAWLGYVTVGATLLYGIVFLVSGSGWFTPGLVGLLSLVIAIVLLRQ
ncbi:MAG: hypothetical protein ACE5M4_06325 [Anaerolineales bacterium]